MRKIKIQTLKKHNCPGKPGGTWRNGAGIMLFGMSIIMALILFVFLFMEMFAMRQNALDEQMAADTVADGVALYAMENGDDYDGLTEKASEIREVIEDETGIVLDSVTIDEGNLDDNTVTVTVNTEYRRLTNTLLSTDPAYTLSAVSGTQYSVSSSGGNGDVGDPVDGGTGSDVVAYAIQFIGNPYVWGGTSLTDGCDCSGFVMSVYAHFGVSLPHSSYSQRFAGEAVDVEDIRPGDIVCYDGHVGIYVGDNMMVNASNSQPYPRGGIKYTNIYYRDIVAVRRIFAW